MPTPGDYRITILPWPAGQGAGLLAGVDITDDCTLDAFGSINRAVEGDFLNFRTGDLTLGAINDDGKFDDLFGNLGPTDRWQLHVFRRGAIIFMGIILGQGSITFHRKEKMVEITAYGATKVLDEASAETVARNTGTVLTQPIAIGDSVFNVLSSSGFSNLDNITVSDGTNSQTFAIVSVGPGLIAVSGSSVNAFAIGTPVVKLFGPTKLTAQANANDMTLTLDSTTGLLTGDTLHVTDQVNKEDVTVKQVTSSTVVSLEAGIGHTYANGSPVTVNTPFYRYKTVDFLVRQLFAAAAVPVAEVKISASLFRRLAPTPSNLTGLDLTKTAYSSPCDKDGATFMTLVDPTVLNTGPGTYSQASPDGAWTLSDADLRPWVDWSRYYRQDEAGPTILLRNPVGVRAQSAVSGDSPHKCGFDYKPATKTCYFVRAVATSPDVLRKRTTTDGVTWAAAADVSNLAGGSEDADVAKAIGVEFDPQRNLVFCSWVRLSDSVLRFQYYDVGGAAWVNALQADDSGKGYFGAVYVPELDAVLALRASTWNGPGFQIAAFRGSARLWVRPFPSCLVQLEDSGLNEGAVYPTMTLRYVNGSLYCLVISDGALQLVRSDDQFQTYVMRKLADSTSKTYLFAGRVQGRYAIASWQGSTPRGYMAAAPFYAGIVNYADFNGKTVAEALQQIAVLVNATFWVDDDFQGHFVARDQVPAGDTPDLTALDLVIEQGEIQLWDQARQHVDVSGAGVSVTAGNDNFAADNISVTSDLLPNAAYGQALADQYAEFYSKRRAMLQAQICDDEDLAPLYPMRRVFVDGRRFYVHESDHDPMKDEWTVKLLEDLENQPAT